MASVCGTGTETAAPAAASTLLFFFGAPLPLRLLGFAFSCEAELPDRGCPARCPNGLEFEGPRCPPGFAFAFVNGHWLNTLLTLFGPEVECRMTIRKCAPTVRKPAGYDPAMAEPDAGDDALFEHRVHGQTPMFRHWVISGTDILQLDFSCGRLDIQSWTCSTLLRFSLCFRFQSAPM
jgi:hypothetical protein